MKAGEVKVELAVVSQTRGRGRECIDCHPHARRRLWGVRPFSDCPINSEARKRGSTVGRGVIHDVLRTEVKLDRPGRDCLGVANSYAGAGHIQRFGDEIANI